MAASLKLIKVHRGKTPWMEKTTKRYFIKQALYEKRSFRPSLSGMLSNALHLVFHEGHVT
jgi:hypothetical protein